MKNAFEELLDLHPEEKERRGLVHTPAEIAQQPVVWQKTCNIVKQRKDEILGFMDEAGLRGDKEAVVILTGAGSSEFIGNALTPLLRRDLKRNVFSIPTTHFVTHASSTLVRGYRYVVVSFARSGNSPESLATFDSIRRHFPESRQLVITCSREGALALRAKDTPGALCIILPEETNDRSLVMTSSFSSMALVAAGLGLLEQPEKLDILCARLARGAERIIHVYGTLLHDVAAIPFSRACYLGSGTLCGTMQECQLKMVEMTEGRVAARFDSYLGLRHGPQVFVDDRCIIFASLSTDSYVRQYEMDLLHELKTKKQGCGTLVICGKADEDVRRVSDYIVELYPDETPVDDGFRIMTDLVAGQILATFKSISFGLKPDNPSTAGTINRVVQGVVIYSS